MLDRARQQQSESALGIGSYTVPEAARLLRIPPRNINRWLGGYTFARDDARVAMPPLWSPQLPSHDDHLELGFRDLIELRFVGAFLKAGLGLKTIRNCLEYARQQVGDARPFSTRKFQTDGRTIFLDTLKTSGESEMLDLKKRQFVMKQVIERSFKDLDIENDAVARWRPYRNKASIVIDPTRAFGQPIAMRFGVPTIVLADAVKAEGSVARAAWAYEVPAAVVRDAVNFEASLLAA
jgi:uncharacterized protein (DUF433 family)